MLTKFDIRGIMMLVREYASLHVQAHILAHVKNQDLCKDYTVGAQKIHDQIRSILTSCIVSDAQSKIDTGYPKGYANLREEHINITQSINDLTERVRELECKMSAIQED